MEMILILLLSAIWINSGVISWAIEMRRGSYAELEENLLLILMTIGGPPMLFAVLYRKMNPI